MIPMINGNNGRERRPSAFAVAQVAERSNHDDLTQEHRDNRDGAKAGSSARPLEAQGDDDDGRCPDRQDCSPGNF